MSLGRAGVVTGLRPRQWLAIAILGVASSATLATPAVAAAQAPADARAWLARLQTASATANFSGTFVVTSGGVAASSRIVHAWDGRQTFELVESLDGPPHQVLRHNDLVKTVWPQSRAVLIERRQHDLSFPFLLGAGGSRIADHYEWTQTGVERVAGHEAIVLTMRPRDEFRLAYRLWSEVKSGLLLRADVLGPKGEVLESSAFSQVTIGQRAGAQEVQQALARAAGYQALKSPYVATDLRQEGWVLDAGVAGFQQVSCVRRPAPKSANGLVPAAGMSDRAMIQAVYSDGLSSVSVFIEPAVRDGGPTAIRSAAGALSTLTQVRDAWRVTLVGDVPPVTLERFAAGLRRAGP